MLEHTLDQKMAMAASPVQMDKKGWTIEGKPAILLCASLFWRVKHLGPYLQVSGTNFGLLAEAVDKNNPAEISGISFSLDEGQAHL